MHSVRRSRIIAFTISIGAFAIASGITCGSCEAQVDDANRVLNAMFAARSELKSGVYHIEGERCIQEDEKKESYPLTVDCTFDYANNLSNFRRVERVPFARNDGTVEGRECVLHLIRRPECTYEYSIGLFEGNLCIRNPDYEPTDVVNPFDFRVLGLFPRLDSMELTNFQKTADSWTSGKTKYRLLSSEELIKCMKTDDVWEIQWGAPKTKPIFQRTLWVDEGKQFAPVKMTVGIVETEPDATSALREDCEVKWQKVSDIWVPWTAHMQSRSDRSTKSNELKFTWNSVNESIDPVTFDIKSIKAPGDTLVVDHRAGDAVIVSKFKNLSEAPIRPLTKSDEKSLFDPAFQ